jgi:DNA end-binding protein Ku
VPYEQIVKGYEISSGHYVTLDDEELSSLDPEAVRTIDISEFVDLADIDPLFYENAYYLAPESTAVKPYALPVQAMEKSGKVAIANFVMRTKQYLAAVRAKDGVLVLSTMVYADEINEPKELPDLEEADSISIEPKELEMAVQLIESLSDEFEPEKYHDTYREAVLGLIEKKAAGEEIVATSTAPEPAKVVDLMAALEQSVKDAKASRKRHPTAHDEGKAATKRAAKPAAKKKAKAAKKTAKRKSA